LLKVFKANQKKIILTIIYNDIPVNAYVRKMGKATKKVEIAFYAKKN
jgi:hypothetical protein